MGRKWARNENYFIVSNFVCGAHDPWNTYEVPNKRSALWVFWGTKASLWLHMVPRRALSAFDNTGFCTLAFCYNVIVIPFHCSCKYWNATGLNTLTYILRVWKMSSVTWAARYEAWMIDWAHLSSMDWTTMCMMTKTHTFYVWPVFCACIWKDALVCILLNLENSWSIWIVTKNIHCHVTVVVIIFFKLRSLN